MNVVVFSKVTMKASEHAESCSVVKKLLANQNTKRAHANRGLVVITMDQWDAEDAAERGIKTSKCACAKKGGAS